jgi:acyl-CoA thioester hydrolase
MTRARFKHWTTQEVRWGDMDALGHVNNSAYFVYCESGRMAFFGDLGMVEHTGGGARGPALATANLEFKQQVRHPATLDIGLAVERIGGSSFTLIYGLFRAGEDEVVAQGQSVVVWVDYAAGRSEALPDALRDALGAYQAGSPS